MPKIGIGIKEISVTSSAANQSIIATRASEHVIAIATFDPGRKTVVTASPGLSRGIEPGPDGWQKIWVDLATTDGQISITVNHSNYHGRALKAQTLTFSTTMKTRVTFKHGATAINDGAKGVLKFKAPLRHLAGTDMATTLQTSAKALHIIDQARH